MKRVIIALLAFYCNCSFCQTTPDYDNIKLIDKGDYQVAERNVMQAANYILSTPFEKDDLTRLKSLQFIIKWMTGTPDFSFSLDEMATKMAKGNDDVLGVYMVCMTKYCLENKASSKDGRAVKLNSIKMLLSYCENANNKLKLTKQLKKLSEANQNGELEKEL